MGQQFTNNARAAVLTAISAIDTTILITSLLADSFPTANTNGAAVGPSTSWFKATLEDSAGNIEIVYVRTRAGGSNVLSNVQRGQEGTAARSFGVGSIISLRLTAVDHSTVRELADGALQRTEAEATNGATLLGATDGASGTLWATVQGFINYLLSSAGASVLGYIQSGAGAVARKIRDVLRGMPISPADYGAVGDGTTNDTASIVNLFLRTNKTIDTGGPEKIYYLVAADVLSLTGGNTIEILDGIELIGQGTFKILSNQLADGTRFEIVGDRVKIGRVKFTESNATLSRSNVYGTLSASGASGFEIDHTEFDRSNGAAIHCRENCSNFTINRPKIRNTKADGIHIQRGCHDFLIIDPDTDDTEDDSIGLVSHGIDEGFLPVRRGKVIGGKLGNQQNGAVGSGLAIIGAHDIQADIPVSENSGLSGIRIAAFNDPAEGVSAARNITINCPVLRNSGLTTSLASGLVKDGISVSDSYKVTINLPDISGAVGGGISISGSNVDLKIVRPGIQEVDLRGIWIPGGTTSDADLIDAIWGDDPRGVGATSVVNENTAILDPEIDRSGTDGFYADGTAATLKNPTFRNVKVRRSNVGNTSGKYGIFIKGTDGGVFDGLSGGASASGTALTGTITFTGVLTNYFIDRLDERIASLTIPFASPGGVRHFWWSAFPASPTGVAGGYKIGDIVWYFNPAGGIAFAICTADGDPGSWATVST